MEHANTNIFPNMSRPINSYVKHSSFNRNSTSSSTTVPTQAQAPNSHSQTQHSNVEMTTPLNPNAKKSSLRRNTSSTPTTAPIPIPNSIPNHQDTTDEE